ncbi:sensor domain-containing diguanylate cyclase [Streptomyces sedi]
MVDVARGMAAERGLAQAARAGVDRARRALGGSHAAISVWERAPGSTVPPRLRVLADVGESADGEDPPALVAPILVHGGEWGELRVVRGREQPAFTPEEQAFAPALAAVLAAGFAQYERLREIRRLAFTDALTGLANRRAVDHALAEALRGHRERGAVLTLVVCDVNGLKRVNDTHGHAVGDRLLIRFAGVLSRAAEPLPGALAARLGGDEFCLLAVEADPAEVERAAAEVCRGAAALELSEGVACGVASTGAVPGRLRSGRRLFRLADAAQYRAKAARSQAPVVAGRGDWERVAALPPAPPGGERRAFRGRERPPPVAGSG